MIDSATEVFLRSVPAELQAGIDSGAYKLWGSIVREVATGRITGFLQETAGAPKLASYLGGSLDIGTGTLGLVGQSVAVVQNEQIKAAVQLVQGLQVTNLFMSAAGIGVSVAAATVLAAKITRVERAVEGVSGRLDLLSRSVDALRRERIAEDLDRLRAFSEQMEEGWTLADPAPQWRNVATGVHELAIRFERRAGEMLDHEPNALDLLLPITEALALATSLRVSARLGAGDDLVAAAAAEDGARAFAAICDRVEVGSTVLENLATKSVEPGSAAWSAALEAEAVAVTRHFAGIRALEAGVASSALLIQELEALEITGRGWLETARSEVHAPLLYVPSA